MNERIKQLAEQARDYVADAIELGFPQDQIDDIRDEKFAELIAQECADICMEMATKCAGLPGDGALAKDCADWIKKNFGVDEWKESLNGWSKK